MKAKTWLQFAACVLLLLNAGCDADYPSQPFINKANFTYAGHENNAVEDLELWTMPLETDESGEVITEQQERNKNRFVRQPTLEELRESLDRVNKVISRIDKVLVSQQ